MSAATAAKQFATLTPAELEFSDKGFAKRTNPVFTNVHITRVVKPLEENEYGAETGLVIISDESAKFIQDAYEHFAEWGHHHGIHTKDPFLCKQQGNYMIRTRVLNNSLAALKRNKGLHIGKVCLRVGSWIRRDDENMYGGLSFTVVYE